MIRFETLQLLQWQTESPTEATHKSLTGLLVIAG